MLTLKGFDLSLIIIALSDTGQNPKWLLCFPIQKNSNTPFMDYVSWIVHHVITWLGNPSTRSSGLIDANDFYSQSCHLYLNIFELSLLIKWSALGVIYPVQKPMSSPNCCWCCLIYSVDFFSLMLLIRRKYCIKAQLFSTGHLTIAGSRWWLARSELIWPLWQLLYLYCCVSNLPPRLFDTRWRSQMSLCHLAVC